MVNTAWESENYGVVNTKTKWVQRGACYMDMIGLSLKNFGVGFGLAPSLLVII